MKGTGNKKNDIVAEGSWLVGRLISFYPAQIPWPILKKSLSATAVPPLISLKKLAKFGAGPGILFGVDEEWEISEA